jgi:two-component system, cell cycle sensor histidine kinase and response regulator CckA
MNQRLRILIIEDSEDDAELLIRQIRRSGYQVVYERVDTPAAMRASLLTQPPWTIIIADQFMPRFKASEALALLQSTGLDIPFLVVTGQWSEDEAAAIMRAGAVDFIRKENLSRLMPAIEREMLQAETRQARRQAEDAARKSAAELQAVFDAFPDQFFRLDGEGNILNYYTGRPTQLDMAPKDLLGRRLADVLPPAAATLLQEAVLQTHRTGQLETVEYALPSPQGTQIYEARLIPFPEQQVIAILRDVTEHKRVLAQMFNSQKLVDLGTLAAGVAHELNSPLQVITGLSESLLNRIKLDDCDPARLNQNLETINRSGWRCAEIVRSLLTYARASTSQIQPHDLNTLVRDTLLLIEHQLRSWSNITVATQLAPQLPPLPCDRNQITQILINLLTNARDAMPEGGEITIRTEHDAAAARLRLQVSDIGPGITAATRARIFEPFFTTKPAGQGTGLGLYIVAGIVRAYGGEILVDSTVGAGTTFTLLFPEQAGLASGEPPVTAETSENPSPSQAL